MVSCLTTCTNCLSITIPDECKPENHKFLDEDWRYHSRFSSDNSYKKILVDDDDLATGWYKFTKSSHRMMEKDNLYYSAEFENVRCISVS